MADFEGKIQRAKDFLLRRKATPIFLVVASAATLVFLVFGSNFVGSSSELSARGDADSWFSLQIREGVLARLGAVLQETLGDLFGVSGGRRLLAEVPLDAPRGSRPPPLTREEDAPPLSQPSAGAGGALDAGRDLPGATENAPAPARPPSSVPQPKPKSAAVAPPASPPAPPPSPVPAPCGFFSNAKTDRTVIINEVAWMGSPAARGETATQAAGNEWIEIKNISGATHNLSGWRFIDSDEKISVLFGDVSIGAHSFLLLERTDDDSVPSIAADTMYSGALSNNGAWIKLFNERCEVVDEVNASAGWNTLGGNNDTKQTLERDSNGLSWHTSASAGGTPKKENSELVALKEIPPPAPPPPPSPSPQPLPPPSPPSPTSNRPTHLVISEIQITGGSGFANHDFIQIFNPTVSAIDVSGWKLRKRTQGGTESSVRVFPDGSSIAAGGTFLWANSDNGFWATVGVNVSSTQTLTDNSSIALLDAAGTLIDALAWGSGHANPYIEGSAHPENPGANQILKRKSLNGVLQDTDSNANDFSF